jgi:hypothetical protein
VNLALADGAGEQSVPLVAVTPEGDTWVAWFDGSSGAYQVRLQRLDPAGTERWPHNGMLVSAHPQNTAIYGWDMIADRDGNAVVVFSDIRDGGDLDTFAYRIAPDGTFLWGPNGVQLSVNPDFDPAPHVAQASDGDFVFVWQRDPAAGDGDIRMQRLAPDGSLRFAVGGIPVVVSAGEDPGFVDLAAADNGTVILSWLRNIRSFSSPRHLRARKFDATGAPVWPSFVNVYDAFSLPLGYAPKIRADGAGGAWLWWHRSDGSTFNSFVQHLDAAGTELYPHLGVEVSTTPGMYHIDPALAIAPDTGLPIIFWNERNSTQSQWGIYAQKLDASGVRQWGAGGVVLIPVSTVPRSFPRAAGYADGAIAVLEETPSTDRLIALRVDGSGAPVWASPIVVSSAASGKARYPIAADAAGVVRVVWEDDRAGSVDVYGQNLNPDGTLGLPGTAGDVGPTLRLAKSLAVPGDLDLSWGTGCGPGAVDYAIYEGTIGAFTSHAILDCSDDGADRTERITPSGSAYYFVVPLGAGNEGSYGTDSAGAERPPASPACAATQVTADCPF